MKCVVNKIKSIITWTKHNSLLSVLSDTSEFESSLLWITVSSLSPWCEQIWLCPSQIPEEQISQLTGCLFPFIGLLKVWFSGPLCWFHHPLAPLHLNIGFWHKNQPDHYICWHKLHSVYLVSPSAAGCPLTYSLRDYIM